METIKKHFYTILTLLVIFCLFYYYFTNGDELFLVPEKYCNYSAKDFIFYNDDITIKNQITDRTNLVCSVFEKYVTDMKKIMINNPQYASFDAIKNTLKTQRKTAISESYKFANTMTDMYECYNELHPELMTNDAVLNYSASFLLNIKNNDVKLSISDKNKITEIIKSVLNVPICLPSIFMLYMDNLKLSPFESETEKQIKVKKIGKAFCSIGQNIIIETIKNVFTLDVFKTVPESENARDEIISYVNKVCTCVRK